MKKRGSLIDNGVAAAALLGAGIGCFALGLLTLLTKVSGAIENALDFYAPTGPVSGITTLAVIVWLFAWAVLHRLWRNRPVDFRKMYIVALVLVCMGLLGCFPFFEAPEWGPTNNSELENFIPQRTVEHLDLRSLIFNWVGSMIFSKAERRC